VFFLLWIVYKLLFKTKQLAPQDVDLVSGLRAIDEEEKKYLAEEAMKGPQSRLGKLWDSL